MKKNLFIRFLKYLALATVVIILSLAVYYSLYKSETIDSGIYKPDLVFNKHTAQLRGVRFNPNGLIVSAGVDSNILIWDHKGEVKQRLKHPVGVTSIDVAANGDIISGSYDGITRLWNSAGSVVREFGKGPVVWAIAFSPDGLSIATAGEDKIVHIWETLTGRLIRNLQGHTLNIWSVRFSPDGSYVASAGFDATIKLWSIQDGRLLKTIKEHSEAVVDIAFNPAGDVLASTSDDATIKLWSMPEGKLIRKMEVNEHIQSAAFSPDGKLLITSGRDKTMLGELFQEVLGDGLINDGVSMRLWNVEDGKLLQTFSIHKNDVNEVAFSADGKWIVSGSEDKTVRLWRRSKESEL